MTRRAGGFRSDPGFTGRRAPPRRGESPPAGRAAGQGARWTGRARGRQLRDEDELSFRQIAEALDAEGLRTKNRGRWHLKTVRRMLANSTDRPPTLRQPERTA
ncbi:recombinase family protein [Streptomyces ochraceiscleroticus]|uniref:recombinase family protein n=1 Tax=Streptomyces ochraceiscleroticus TaxID=47761 RepID=UPI00099784C2